MVFNKLRKGERRSIGHLRSSSGSASAGAQGRDSLDGNPPLPSGQYGSVPSSPAMMTTTQNSSTTATYGTAEESELLHIRLRDEMARNAANSGNRASQTHPRTSAPIAIPSSPPQSGPYSQTSSPIATTFTAGSPPKSPISSSPSIGGGSKRHGRASSIGSTATGPAGRLPGSNGGWYMTTGVLPSVIGAGTSPTADDNSASSLASRTRKYDSIYRATGLPANSGASVAPPSTVGQGGDLTRNGTMRTTNTAMTQPSAYSQAGTSRSIPLNSYNQEQPVTSAYPLQQQPMPVSAVQQLPSVVTNAGTQAQHRRTPSAGMDRRPQDVPVSPTVGVLDTTTPAIAEMERRQQLQQPVHQNPSKFTEQMDMVGRKSEDTMRLPYLASNNNNNHSHQAGRLDPYRGDELPASEIAKQRDILPVSVQRNVGEGVPSEQAVENNPPLGTAASERDAYLTADEDDSPDAREETRPREMIAPVIPVGGHGQGRVAEMSPIQEVNTPGLYPDPHIRESRMLESAVPMFTARKQPHQQDPAPEAAVVPSSPRNIETVKTATYGPEYQSSRTAPPKVITSTTRKYQNTPVPNISHPLPSLSSPASSLSPSTMANYVPGVGGMDQGGSFGNVANKIPHYMFVTYEAHVCQECVDSDKRMYALQHGGEEWRYDHKDPSEEKGLPSDDPNTVKTGRRDFTDRVSLVPSGRGIGETIGTADGRTPCQCAECTKNRETVRYAAENGLIEQIFDGRRHPLSEKIETITYTTIVRAPIIEETIETLWCEEPNCAECQKKDVEYRDNQYRSLVDGYEGMVIHETDQSNAYEDKYGAKNLWGLKGSAGDASARSDNAYNDRAASSDSRMKTLLSRAGNPRQEGLRSNLTTRTEGALIVGEDALDPSFPGMDDGKLRSLSVSGDGHEHSETSGHSGCHLCEEEGIGYRSLRDKIMGEHERERREGSYVPPSIETLRSRA